MLLGMLKRILSSGKIFLNFNAYVSQGKYKLSETLDLPINCKKNIDRVFNAVYSRSNEEANYLFTLYAALVDIEALAFEGVFNDKNINPAVNDNYRAYVKSYENLLEKIDEYSSLDSNLKLENIRLRNLFKTQNLEDIINYVSRLPKYANLGADLYPIRTAQCIIERGVSFDADPEIIIDIDDRFGERAYQNFAIRMFLENESTKSVYDVISKDAAKIAKVKEYFKNFSNVYFNTFSEKLNAIDMTPEIISKIVDFTYNESIRYIVESAETLKDKVRKESAGKYFSLSDIISSYYADIFGKELSVNKAPVVDRMTDLVDINEIVDEKFKNVVGLREVKEEIKDMLALCKKLKSVNRFDMGQSHMCFLGNPGTGKTTVARIVGESLYKGGFLKTDKFVEIGAASMKGEFVGQTAPKVKDLFEKAKGGVLFIDEAYQLAESSERSDSFGKEALATLIKEMEENPDVLVIFAGYTEPTQKFIDVNPGLRSRINTYIEFNDYSTDELLQIAKLIADKNKFKLVDGALEELRTYFDKSKTEKDFANGRFVRSIISAAELIQSRRSTIGDFNISADDVRVAIAKKEKQKNNGSKKRESIGF